MNHTIYKLCFMTGVHFGNGMLNDTDETFPSDVLFSALFIEALKIGKSQEFLLAASEGRIAFSDAFPYKGSTYFIPKPMVYIDNKENGSSEEKKKYKNLKYLPVQFLEDFVGGRTAIEDLENSFGHYNLLTKVSLRNAMPDPLPYHVGSFCFDDHCGLYVIVIYKDESDRMLMDELMELLSYSGIGGERSSGLGKYELLHGKPDPVISAMLDKKDSEQYILLSSALPREEELDTALEGASYKMKKRSGFVYSPFHSDSPLRKQDLYVFSAGSCFRKCFEGDIYDVSDGSPHPVYRYAKAMFMGVDG